MSETTQNDVHSLSANVSEEEVAKVNTAPAPASPFEQFMAKASADIAMLKSVLGLAEPLVNEVAPLAGAVVPQAAPVLDRLPAIETDVGNLLDRVSGLESAATDMSKVHGVAQGLAAAPALTNAVNGIIGALSSAFADHPTLPKALPKPVTTAAPVSSGG